MIDEFSPEEQHLELIPLENFLTQVELKDDELSEATLDHNELEYSIDQWMTKLLKCLYSLGCILILIVCISITNIRPDVATGFRLFWSYVLIVECIFAGYFWYQLHTHEAEPLTCCCERPSVLHYYTVERYSKYIETARAQGIQIDPTRMVHPVRQAIDSQRTTASVEDFLSDVDD